MTRARACAKDVAASGSGCEIRPGARPVTDEPDPEQRLLADQRRAANVIGLSLVLVIVLIVTLVFAWKLGYLG